MTVTVYRIPEINFYDRIRTLSKSQLLEIPLDLFILVTLKEICVASQSEVFLFSVYGIKSNHPSELKDGEQ